MNLGKHWWAIFIRGIVAILFGILLLTATGFTMRILIIFLGLYFLIDGILAIIASGVAASKHKSWWLLLLEGLVSLGIGIFVLVLPSLTLLVLLYLIAIWAIITGIFEFVASIVSSWAASGKIFLGIVGVLSVILGLVIILYPTLSLIAITWLVAIYAFVIGLSLIFFSFKLRVQSETELSKEK